MPIRRRRATASTPGPLMSSPSNRRVPSIRAPGIRSFIRLKQRSSVLLPQPEGPISAVIWLRGISIAMSFSASDVPYQTDRSRAARTTGAAVATAAGDGEGAGVSGGTGAAWAAGRLIAS